jgi:tRNA threonylcarbamoyladenosine biosynthesis protein TsaE
MTEYISHNIEETKVIAQKVLDTNARVIALQGNLGAGKTAITKCIAELLGITEAVTSPTFVIMKKYTPPNMCLIHIDAYRIQTENELDLLNLNDLIKDDKNLIIIEWPEQTMKLLPPETLIVQCEFIDEMTRKYSF